MLTIEKQVKDKYPDLYFGIMVMDHVQNPKENEVLDERKKQLEEKLKEKYRQYSKKALKKLEPIQAYSNFYKAFKKTYHVFHQLESIALKEKSFSSGAALVEAMFMSEVDTLLLTAGYDYDKLEGDMFVTLSAGRSTFNGMGHKEKSPPENDVILRDEIQVLGSIICGPEHDSRITPETTKVVFAIYGVPGITKQQIQDHLLNIESNVKCVSPKAQVTHICIK